MTEQLKNKLETLPEEPGIYKFLNSKGIIIYIGKSKCLKKRVKSYFAPSPTWDKAKKMVLFIQDIDYITTDTNLEAMMLECELIKKIQPYFNVIMKNDERYVYLKINQKGKHPFSIVYQKENNCYGPFRSKSKLQNALNALQSIYPIVLEKRSFLYEYHIFPNVMDRETFLNNKEVLEKILKNPNSLDRFSKSIEKKMKFAAVEYKYETASLYKDLLDNVSYIKNSLNQFTPWDNKTILLNIPIKKGYKLFFIANWEIIDKITLDIVTDENKAAFLKTAQQKLIKKHTLIDNINKTPKGTIDFKGILYSELINYSVNELELL